MSELILTIELVPKTCWYKNLRSELPKDRWNKLRYQCYRYNNYVCELCGDHGLNQGFSHRVECHEKWSYNDFHHIQKLEGLMCLCPRCHKVKHMGLAHSKGELGLVLKQLKRVNYMDDKQALKYVKQSYEVWRERSQWEWKLDVSWLLEN